LLGNASTAFNAMVLNGNNDVFDLALTMRPSRNNLKPFLYPGLSYTYEITINNEGDFIANGIELVVHIPEGFELADTNWIYEHNPQSVEYEISGSVRVKNMLGKAFRTLPNILLPSESRVVTIQLNVLEDVDKVGFLEAEISQAFDEQLEAIDDIDSAFDSMLANYIDNDDDYARTYQSMTKPLDMVVYDLQTGIADTIPPVDFDINVSDDSTPYFLGTYNEAIAPLSVNRPIEDSYSTGTVFYYDGNESTSWDISYSKANLARESFDLNDYPIRTVSKVKFLHDDGRSSSCSATMVSKSHILTARHCPIDFETGELRTDNIRVCPVLDRGAENPNFPCVKVTKIYTFDTGEENLDDDYALLELAEPIGEKTGWVGLMFNEEFNDFKEVVYHKFAYPIIDPSNGTSSHMYHSYGNSGFKLDFGLFVSNQAYKGESGSTLIRVSGKHKYRATGVFSQSFSSTSYYPLLKSWSFFAFKEVIDDHMTSQKISNGLENIRIYPNPSIDQISVVGIDPQIFGSATIFDQYGRTIHRINEYPTFGFFNIATLPSGLYFLRVNCENSTGFGSFMKAR